MAKPVQQLKKPVAWGFSAFIWPREPADVYQRTSRPPTVEPGEPSGVTGATTAATSSHRSSEEREAATPIVVCVAGPGAAAAPASYAIL